ncbi:MAG: isocitrate/isopropylmalate family dehydrogenase [Pseudomonadota bacterium]|nr:isocitrate/isopropylmalate family dehydrogenase [Pseudomonadota bacterium]
MENMFGDILSDLGGGLVGGMGMAACAELGDETGLFQPAHCSSPDIMGMDRANQMAAISIGAMMLDFLADKLDRPGHAAASHLLDQAITTAFARNRVRPMDLAAMWTQNLLQTPLPRPVRSCCQSYNSSR